MHSSTHSSRFLNSTKPGCAECVPEGKDELGPVGFVVESGREVETDLRTRWKTEREGSKNQGDNHTKTGQGLLLS